MIGKPQRARRQHACGSARARRAWWSDQRGRSARNRLGRPQPRRGGQGAGRAGLVRAVQFDHQHRRVAGGGRQAVRDHPALAHRRQQRPGQERPADRKADAGGDTAAARRRSATSPISTPRPIPTPNELARKAADELARNFKCGKDEVKVIGETGRAVSHGEARELTRAGRTRRDGRNSSSHPATARAWCLRAAGAGCPRAARRAAAW